MALRARSKEMRRIMEFDGSFQTDENYKPSKPFIRVDYKEFEPETYWGVVVERVDGTEDIFFSQDFKRDLGHAMNKYPDHCMKSSVTQFISDAKIEAW
jgi:hypothetical protein